ncbi:MAG: T9SS type A sorting domain-containing protein, partial [Candidatus Fermentibacteria bacterium]|nr:T9SS type A sorting domain-containing protein [Candidatus Fermentibacteria bacterium]
IAGFLRIAQWSGSQWDITTIDSGEDFLSHGISLALDNSGNPHIACRKNDDLCYYYFDGSQWNDEVIDSGLFSLFCSASITVDSNGYPHIAYSVLDGSTYTIIYQHNDGSGWMREELEPGSSPSIIIDSFGDPAIAFAHSTGGVKYLCHNTVGIFDDPVALELLGTVRPNPASSVAWIDIALKTPGNVGVTLCDLSGRLVHQLEFIDVPQGAGVLEIDLSGLSSGMYTCRITSAEGSAATRLTVLR